MNYINGYIYIRNHKSYKENNVCKMGKTLNITSRDIQYATGEITRGYFESIYVVPLKKMGIIEKSLKKEFCKLNIKCDAGTEFYDIKIINFIEPYFISQNIEYVKLTQEEIDKLINRKTTTKSELQQQPIVEKDDNDDILDILKPFGCLFCENKYSSNDSLRNHTRIYHEKEHSEKIFEKRNNKFKCKYCCKEYSHTQSKYAHQKICKKKQY